MKYLIATLTTIILIGCSAETTTKTTKGPGVLSLGKQALSLEKAISGIPEESTVDFPLETARQSFRAYFFGKNIGESVITNLTITTSDSAIRMSPSYIPELQPDENSSFVQLLTLNVIHGTSLPGGAPIEKLLPYGVTYFTVYFDGESAGEPFHAEYTFSVGAIYVDVAYDPKVTIPFTIGSSMALGTDTCNVWNNGEKLSIGDTADYAFEIPKPVRMDEDSVWINKYDLWPGKWQSDCVIRQALPVELQ